MLNCFKFYRKRKGGTWTKVMYLGSIQVYFSFTEWLNYDVDESKYLLILKKEVY